jgi:hypothetical protein
MGEFKMEMQVDLLQLKVLLLHNDDHGTFSQFFLLLLLLGFPSLKMQTGKYKGWGSAFYIFSRSIIRGGGEGRVD